MTNNDDFQQFLCDFLANHKDNIIKLRAKSDSDAGINVPAPRDNAKIMATIKN